MKTTYTFTITLEVNDPKSIRRKAVQRARRESGIFVKEYDQMRKEYPGGPVASDLVMLLDPGTLAGTSIVAAEASVDE